MMKTGSGLGRKRRKVRLFEARREKKIGQPPGTPVHVGAVRDFQPWASFVHYSSTAYGETAIIVPEQIRASLKPDQVNWINVEGVHDVPFIQVVSNQFDLHPLTQEDIVNTSHRPQFESYAGYFFFAMKMLYTSPEGHLVQEHISLVLQGNTVITFQETPGDVFGRIRDRIRSQTGKIRARGADYLLYLLLDSIVDGYYQVVDRLGERIDTIEEELRCGPSDPQLARIFEMRREILLLRKNIIPVRDLLNKVQVEG
ncbi:MAG TPA: CorA family divalent cation transporter, partial [Bdellovibrionales bacterium]|nr:CorA family divalent cation transporter [Bdellovibrionales bacterium]